MSKFELVEGSGKLNWEGFLEELWKILWNPALANFKNAINEFKANKLTALQLFGQFQYYLGP